MLGKKWFLVLLSYLLVTSVALYFLYRVGYYARPWAVGFEAAWFVLCGIFFWKMIYGHTSSIKKALRAFGAAWIVVLAAWAINSILVIGGQLLMIKYRPPVDAWDGVLAGYARLHVYESYALTYKIDPLAQFTAAGEFRVELGLVLIVSLLAMVFVKRQQIADENLVNRRVNKKK